MNVEVCSPLPFTTFPEEDTAINIMCSQRAPVGSKASIQLSDLIHYSMQNGLNG